MNSGSGNKTIAELISALPEEEKLILTLHLVNLVSTSDIAKKLGVPARAAISVIARVTSRLIGLISKGDL